LFSHFLFFCPFKLSLAGIIYGRSSIKIAHFVLIL
jgi:hypothetical protein